MTAKEFALAMGKEHGYRLSKEEAKMAEENGLIVMTGRSYDFCGDLVMDACFYGVIHGLIHVCDTADILITPTIAATIPDCGTRCCKFFKLAMAGAKKIVFHCMQNSETIWATRTSIPHETFPVFDSSGFHVIDGIVISVEDLK